MSALAFRLFTRNGVEMHGGANLQVSGRFSVEITTRPGIASIALMDRFGGRIACLRRWARVTPETLIEALEAAQSLAAQQTASVSS